MRENILWKRLYSLVIMMTMVSSSFGGLIAFGAMSSSQGLMPSELPNGDVFLGADYETSIWEIDGRVHMMDGNLTIRNGGILIIQDGGLSFTQDTGYDGVPGTSDDRVYTLTIEDGGQMILRNSTLTTCLDLIYDYPSLGVLVRNGAVLEVNDSTLQFPGHIVIDDSTFIMRNSTMKGHSDSDISAYCNSDYFPSVAFDDSAVTLFMSSDIYLYDSSIEGLFEGDLTGETAIYNQTYSFASEDGNRDWVTYNLSRNPAQLGAGNDCAGEDMVNLTMDDSLLFTVEPAETLGIDVMDIAGLLFDETEVTVTLHVKYKTDPDYAGTNAFEWGFANGGMSATSIVPEDTAEEYNSSVNNEVIASALLPAMDQSDLSLMDITFTNDDPANKNVYVNRVWVTVEFSLMSYRNLTAAGSTDFTAVNTFLDVDFSSTNISHNMLVMEDQAKAYFYGVYVNTTGSAEQPAYICTDSSVIVRPLEVGPNDDTGEDISNLCQNDSSYYVVGSGETLEIDSWNVSGLGEYITGAKLWIAYRTGPAYVGIDYLQYAMEGASYENSSIGIETGATVLAFSFDLIDQGVNLLSELSDLNVTLENTGGAAIEIDALWIELTYSPTVYIYRWVSLSAIDSQGLPIKDAAVKATMYPSGEQASYVVPGGIQDEPPTEVLEYLGKNNTSYNITDSAGEAIIPLMTEYVDESTMPNSQIIGSYDLNVTYTNASMVDFYAHVSPNFDSPYPSIGENDQTVEVVVQLEELILDKPDVVVSDIDFDTSPIYDYQTIIIRATINNTGNTAARNFTVKFIDFFSGVTSEIANQTIDTLDSGASVQVDVSWVTPAAGLHSITVIADPEEKLIEENENNNELSTQMSVLAQLPDLSITTGDIAFDPQPAYTNSPLTIQATIGNALGKASAENVTVMFYAGNPDTGGLLIGETKVDVPMGGSNTSSLDWVPSQIGIYPIYVVINPERLFGEYDYDNNIASRNTTVELSLNPPFDIVVNGTNVLSLVGDTFNHPGNVVVMDSGTLIIDQATLNIKQNKNNQFQILVQDDGVLMIVNSTLSSNYNLRVYLFDNASMMVDPSTVQSTVAIQMEDNASLSIEDSQIAADIIAVSGSDAILTAVNTTFTKTWSGFGGNAIAYLTAVSAPSLVAKENAVIYHYRWLEVEVLDGTGAELPDAYVGLSFYFNDTQYASAMTDSNGEVLFRCLCDRITSTSSEFYGNYKVNATYWYEGERYDTDDYTSVSFSPYDTPLVRSDKRKILEISSALPDLDPPFFVSDTNPAREQEVQLMANISNVGVVPASNVLVRFQDNDTIIEDVTLDVIDPGETISITTTWVAGYPLGWHNLSVTVDPLGVIPELDKSNNMNYTMVMVSGIVELVITQSDVSVSPSSPTVNSSVSITIEVHNTGDIAAEDVNITLHDTPLGEAKALVGYAIINEIEAGDSQQVTLVWTPTVPGNHTINVMVDEVGEIEELHEDNNEVLVYVHVKEYADLVVTYMTFSPAGEVNVGSQLQIEVEVENWGETSGSNVLVRFWLGSVTTGQVIDEVYIADVSPGFSQSAIGIWQANTSDYQKLETRTITVQVNPDDIILESNYSNNDISSTINVVDLRPNLVFVGDIAITSGNEEVDNATFGEIVHIIADVKNDGYTSVLGTTIQVMAVDNDSYITHIATLSKDFMAEETITLNVTWSVNATIGDNDIIIQLNVDQHIEERYYADDNATVAFSIGPPNPLIVIDLGGILQYRSDSQVVVRGTVLNEINNEPLSDISMVITLNDMGGAQIGDSRTTITSSTGYYETTLYIPPGIEGNYLIGATANMGERSFLQQQGIDVEPPFSETTLPWWVWIIIIVVVGGVIIGFSAYLFKYGLGKMVECGECGALIPANSKKCPKCGVEFETGTAKCSECGAWIPASAKVCPECGAKFVGEAIGEEEDEYIKKMREQYDALVTEKREQAKESMGKKYSDAKFLSWWKKQPDYITFEQWLSTEEEKRKSGSFPCPVCGTLNPRGATICHKCGTVFEATKMEEEPKRRPLRRIVRRPAGKKPKEETEEAESGAKESPEQSGEEPSEQTPDTEEPSP